MELLIHDVCLLLLFSFAVTSILVVFVKMFNKSRDENAKLAEAEKKKVEKDAMKDKADSSAKKDISDADRSKFNSWSQKSIL